MNKPTLENIKNLAFLSNESYKMAVDDVENKNKEISKKQPLKNPATNSSFEVVKQKNEYTAFEKGFGFSATVFKNTETNEYVIAFRGTRISDPVDLVDNAIMGATSTGLLGDVTNKQFSQAFAFAIEQIAEILAKDPDAKISLTGHSLGGALA